MLMNPEADEIAKIIAEEKVKVVTTGAGNPAKYMDMWKEAGVIVIPVVASVALAKLMERGGASAVIAEGMESGGVCSDIDVRSENLGGSNRRGNGVRRTYRSTDYHDTCATGC